MSDSVDIRKMVEQVQDFLAPRLDCYEQMIYHYLFRHTRLHGKQRITVGTRTIQGSIGAGMGKEGSPPSQRVISDKLRTLERKGCIKILERSAQGTALEVLLPDEIPGIVVDRPQLPQEDIDTLDFFNDPQRRLAILRRENGRCFWCLRGITEANYSLDHVSPRSGPQEDHTYRNLVACCWECNSRKQATGAEEFLRRLYREGLLSADDHRERVEAIEALRSGRLVPVLDLIAGAGG
jgi:hypothetical protein